MYELGVNNEVFPRDAWARNDTYYLILPVQFTLVSRDWNIWTTFTHLFHNIQFGNELNAISSQNNIKKKRNCRL